MSEISERPPRAGGKLSWPVVILISVASGVVFVLLFNAPCHTLIITPEIRCRQNLTNLSVAMLIYAFDHDTYPLADNWCEALAGTNVPQAGAFVCPLSTAEEGQCSYALNAHAAGQDPRTLPEDMVLLFESEPGWNQTGGPEQLTLSNHEGKGCHVCFAGGRIEFVKLGRVGRLRWTAEGPSRRD